MTWLRGERNAGFPRNTGAASNGNQTWQRSRSTPPVEAAHGLDARSEVTALGTSPEVAGKTGAPARIPADASEVSASSGAAEGRTTIEGTKDHAGRVE